MPTLSVPSVDMRRIGLGTVQFGLDYGVSNSAGKTPKEEAARIVLEAASMGIGTLDTAADYGDSEAVLGEILRPGHEFNIVTKTIQFDKSQIEPQDGEALQVAFRDSLKRLGQKRVYALLAHNANDLLANGGRFLWHSMSALKGDDLATKIGASVYTATQIDALLDQYNLDIIQIPLNVFDQRLINSGHLKKLKTRRVEIHVRSVFLQGLLLMSPEDVPTHLAGAQRRLHDWRTALAIEGMSPLAAALGFVLSLHEVDRAVVGVCNVDQLHELARAVGVYSEHTSLNWSNFALDDEMILNPAHWPKDMQI